MSLDRIRQGVLAEAQAEADRILAEAQAAREERLGRARARAERRRAERVEAERRRLAQERSQALANAARLARVAVLQEKNAFIARAFQQAQERVLALPDDQYLALIERWLLALDPGVGGEAHRNARDAARVNADFLARVNEARPPSGRFALGAADREIAGGVIVATERYQVDLSLEAMLAALQETLAPRIAETLFPEDGDG